MCGELGLDEIPLVPVLLSSGQRGQSGSWWFWFFGVLRRFELGTVRTCSGCVRVYVRRTGSGRDSFGSGVVEFGAAGSERIMVVLVLRRVVSVRWRCLAGGCGGKVKGFDRDDVRG
ncbi:hypothetical protein Droror1_Dr00020344 [Drosera rotundifolia]